MKDSEFIQLLNLYLDHEISPADAVRLEAEVQGNPARRRVYQQYCRMQKACKLLTSEFESEAAALTSSKVVPFEADGQAMPRRAMGGWYALGGLAAAACLAIVFIGRGRQETGATFATTTTPAQVAPVAAKTAVASAGVATAPRAGLQRSSGSLVADPLLLSNQTAGAAVLVSATSADQSQFNWIKTLEIAPMQQQRVAVDELRFDVRPASLRPEGRALGNATAAPMPGKDPQEMVILQFSR